MKLAIGKTMRLGAKGIKTCVSGRIIEGPVGPKGMEENYERQERKLYAQL